MVRLSQLTAALATIETAYEDPAAASTHWLDAIAKTLQPEFDAGDGIMAWCYDARDLSALRLEHVTLLNIDERLLPAIARANGDPRNTDEMRRSHYRTSAGALSASLDNHYDHFLPTWEEYVFPLGVKDLLFVNAMNFGMRGCAFSTPTRERMTREPVRDALLARVAAHVVTAFRLRERTADGEHTVEAVFSPDGRLVHAEGEAKAEESILALQRAAKAMERARGRLRRSEPEEALSIWRTMIEGRWTLVDQFEHDGRRYLVAKTNQPMARPIRPLTERESQVVALASLGRSNKEIAYQLGISEGTVPTMLSRAQKKVGAATLAELLTKLAPSWLTHDPSNS